MYRFLSIFFTTDHYANMAVCLAAASKSNGTWTNFKLQALIIMISSSTDHIWRQFNLSTWQFNNTWKEYKVKYFFKCIIILLWWWYHANDTNSHSGDKVNKKIILPEIRFFNAVRCSLIFFSPYLFYFHDVFKFIRWKKWT